MAKRSTTTKARASAPLKAKGRTLAEFEARGLWPAERELIDACREGRLALFNGGKRPRKRPVKQDANRNSVGVIRGDLLRFLCLGGDEFAPVHELGVMVQGAWIEASSDSSDVLDLNGCVVPANLSCRDCTFDGSVAASDARCQTLALRGSTVSKLSADRLHMSGGIFLNQGFAATGEVRLLGAQIGGNLECTGGQFSNPRAPALHCDGATIKGGVFLNEEFTATGEVRLLGAQIGGNLECVGGQFSNPGADALSCDGATIKGDVFLNKGFTATGAVRLLGAEISGDLACVGGQFSNPEATALHCDRATIKGSVFLDQGFAAKGEVRLTGAQIGGNLSCANGSFGALQRDSATGQTTPARRALNCDGMTVAGALFFRDVKSVIGSVDLVAARVDSLVDDKASWGKPFTLLLDGFTYGAIGSGPTDAETRIAWLERQHWDHLTGPTFCPQPWMQLIRTLRRMGHREEADDVAVAFQKQLHAVRTSLPPHREPARQVARRAGLFLHWCFGRLVGYGYKPLRLVAIMLAVWFGAGLFYLTAAINGGIGPSNPLVFQNPAYAHCRPDGDRDKALAETNAAGRPRPRVEVGRDATGTPIHKPYLGNWYYCADLPGEYTTFQPVLYSLDLILPLVELQQDKDWSPIIPTPTRVTWTVAAPPAAIAPRPAADGTGQGAPADPKPEPATTPPPSAMQDVPASTLSQVAGFVGELFTSWSWGQAARVVMWFEILFGWVSSLLLVAVLTGLTNREKQDDT